MRSAPAFKDQIRYVPYTQGDAGLYLLPHCGNLSARHYTSV